MNRTLLLVLFCVVSVSQIHAQTYQKSLNINPADTSVITSSLLMDDGHMITASLHSHAQGAGGGVPGNPLLGDVMIRKLRPDGKQEWSYAFTHSVANILHMQVNGQGDLIASGVFLDSLIIDQDHAFYSASSFRANAFIICMDTAGNLKWADAHPQSDNHTSYYNVFDIYDDKIYIPYIHYVGFDHSVHIKVYDFDGDSINDIELMDQGMFVSEFEFDRSGNVYLAGTGGSGVKIGDSVIGGTDVFAYLSFMVKVDTNFNYLWSDVYQYVTFDLYPKLAFNEDRVVFMVDTMPNPNGAGNHHILRFYDTNGRPEHYDSIGPGFFSRMHAVMNIIPVNKGFVFSTLSDFSTITVRYVDDRFRYSDLATLKLQTGPVSPWFASNDSVIAYFQNYTDTFAVVNGTDSFRNNKFGNGTYGYQQLVMKFSYRDSTLGINDIKRTANGIMVYPIPAHDHVTVTLPAERGHDDHLNVYNMQGQLIHRQQITSRVSEVDLRNLPEGIYFLRTDSGLVKKIIRQ